MVRAVGGRRRGSAPCLPATAVFDGSPRFRAVGCWMPDGHSWTGRYEALPAAVREEPDSMWDSPADEPEDLAIRYEDRLSTLGL